MFERLSYALIGGVFGALLAAMFWWLYGVGMSIRLPDARIDPTLFHWVRVGAGSFAVLGFLFKDSLATFVGDVFAGIFNYEAGHDSRLNWWQALMVLCIAVAAIWALWRSSR